MYAFQYHRPQSLADAAKLLAGSSEAKLLAGGHTLIPTMKQRLANPPVLIDLARVAELRGIDKKGSALVIGAMTTHDEVAGSSVVRGAIAGLCDVASSIGDPHVRNRGTIGGSVANNDPAADYPAALLALGATIASNKREIAADDFFKGLFETALKANGATIMQTNGFYRIVPVASAGQSGLQMGGDGQRLGGWAQILRPKTGDETLGVKLWELLHGLANCAGNVPVRRKT
jgi:xanthine dehydrogenase iron-sulfur cluster and FAD-binding subunit A